MVERGKFIVFEGIGGCGKTTQVRLAQEYLDKKGISAVVTREPGGVKEAELIRKLIFNLKDKGIINADHQMALFFAARAVWLEGLVKPKRKKGIWVLTDRCDASTNAYQGFGEGGDRKVIKRFSSLVMGRCRPDAILLIDISSETYFLRRGNCTDGDPFDKEPVEYHERVINGYRQMAKENWGHVPWYVINGEPDVKAVSRDIRQILDKLL